MNEWTPAARRAGIVSAWTILAFSAIYVATGALGLRSGFTTATLDDPYRAVLEWIIVVMAPIVVVMMVALHEYAPRDRKVWSAVALAFMIISMGVTSSIHFVELTVARRLPAELRDQLSPLLAFRWPSVAFALDLFAWDFLFGISLLAAALVFRGHQANRALRAGLTLAGGLCLAGTLGPALGDLRFQWLGIVGYAGIFPITSLLLAIQFQRSQ